VFDTTENSVGNFFSSLSSKLQKEQTEKKERVMKTIFYALMILALLAGSLAACQSTNKPIKVSEQDAGKTITLKTGDTLIIELDGNITTGFNWIPTPQDPVLLNQVGEPEVTPESDQVGAPGKIVLQFKAVAQGQTVLHLDFKRSWETDVAPEKSFEVIVVVK
jgi:inhibitor of cysteine peptidase